MFEIMISHLLVVSFVFPENIMVHSWKQADEQSQNIVVYTAIMWRWRDPCLTTAYCQSSLLTGVI